jgi:threonine dehydratase
MTLTLQDIIQARQRITPLARKTPLIPSAPLADRAGAAVYLKLENIQGTGAFKLRGASNKIFSLPEAQKKRGVITVSTGNHGRAVAHVARHLGIKAVVCISQEVPGNKVEALQRLGAEVVIHGHSQDDAFERAAQLEEQRGLTMIPPFDDPHIIAGQGTIGLEMLEDQPQMDAVLVPVSGGGLISGIALAMKSANPAIRVLGISMQRAPVMYHSLRAGKLLQMPEEDTLADSLRGGIGLHNRYTYRMVQDYVDDLALVSEEQIAAAMAFAFQEHHLVLEGAGAVVIAALMHGLAEGAGQHIGLVLSGGNVELELLVKIWQGWRGGKS